MLPRETPSSPLPPRRAAESRTKRTVEIISGCNRRLQGEGEETGTRLQRDRSGVSEMEPLPATQDALRLELRPLPRVWSFATSLYPVSPTSLLSRRGARRGTSVDPFAPSRCHRSRHRFRLRLRIHPRVRSSRQLSGTRGSHKPPPTDFTPITRGESRENPSRNFFVLRRSARAASTVSIAFHWRCR